MQPVEEVFSLCGSFCVQCRPYAVFIAVADEAAQIERLRCVRRDRQDGVGTLRFHDRLGQLALRQDFFRFLIAPVMQAVLCSLRKILHRAGLQENCSCARDDHAHKQEARRRDGVFAFLPCQQQQGNRCRSKEHNARLHKRCRHTQGCQQNCRQSRHMRKHHSQQRQQNACHDPGQPKAGVVRFGKRQEDAFFRRPEVPQRVPCCAEAA